MIYALFFCKAFLNFCFNEKLNFMQNENKQFTPFYWMTQPEVTERKEHVREFVNPDNIPWTDWLMPGTRYKLLYCDLSSGFFNILLQVDPGTEASMHWHLGTAMAYILEGGFHYHEDDKGDTNNCFTCETGGSIHQPFSPQGCIMLGIMHGPIAGYHEGNMVVIADAKLHYEMAKQNDAVKLTTVVGYVHEPEW